MPKALGPILISAFLLLATGLQAEPVSRPSNIDPAFWGMKSATLAGDTLDFKSLRGKYVLLTFWGEWCATCVEEIPFLLKLDGKYSKGGLKIIGLLKSEDRPKAEKLIRKSGMTWPQVPLSENMETMFAIRKFPTNLLISPEGKIVMDGFYHHFQDFKRRMGDVDSATAIGQSAIKIHQPSEKAKAP